MEFDWTCPESVTFDRIDIYTILILSTQEHWRPLHHPESSSTFFFHVLKFLLKIFLLPSLGYSYIICMFSLCVVPSLKGNVSVNVGKGHITSKRTTRLREDTEKEV